MLEPWMWSLAIGVVGLPVAWAYFITSWWVLADLREVWRRRMEAYAVEHDEEYEAPELPASRPALATYLRALTLATGGGAVLWFTLLAAGHGLLAGAVGYLAVRAATALHAQLRVMRESAGRRVPTV